MPERQPMLLAISLDVEEEGLFGGSYVCQNPAVSNTDSLRRLEPLLETGLRPTLFCAFSVLCDCRSRKILWDLHTSSGAQIGAHLHHWCTPPYSFDNRNEPPRIVTSVPAGKVPLELLAAKLDNLINVANDFLGAQVTAFRMGRWDLHADFLPLLAAKGILCDASVRPLHLDATPPGPDHFDAPADPYRIYTEYGEILEVPLTVIPILRNFSRLPRSCPSLRASLRHWGALALLPVQHPLWLMKLTTIMHARRGGKMLSLTWHSSEMMPGGTPYMRTEGDVDAFMRKIKAYLAWLQDTFAIRHVTMDDLFTINMDAPLSASQPMGDWICGSKPKAGLS